MLVVLNNICADLQDFLDVEVQYNFVRHFYTPRDVPGGALFPDIHPFAVVDVHGNDNELQSQASGVDKIESWPSKQCQGCGCMAEDERFAKVDLPEAQHQTEFSARWQCNCSSGPVFVPQDSGDRPKLQDMWIEGRKNMEESFGRRPSSQRPSNGTLWRQCFIDQHVTNLTKCKVKKVNMLENQGKTKMLLPAGLRAGLSTISRAGSSLHETEDFIVNV